MRSNVLSVLQHESELETELGCESIIGNSSAIRKIRNKICFISQKPKLPVLITGETGTGKELVANALHHHSIRARKPIVHINCSAIPDTLLESQLFGHIKGAFTGATQDQIGLVEHANGGTLLFDEIGEMPLLLQPKLLRFLETQCFHRVGESKERKVDVWILAATNARLPDLIAQKKFREDLYYRLNVLNLDIPPLRERLSDVNLLIDHFINKDKLDLSFSDLASSCFGKYSWPGNVRELKNVMNKLHCQNSKGQVQVYDLPQELQFGSQKEFSISNSIYTLAEMEKRYILQVFNRNHRKIRLTARLLGITRNTLKRKLAVYGIGSDEMGPS